MASMASSRWPCWKTARTSITESISAPLGVYLLTGDRGDSARNSHRVRSPEEAPTGVCGDKGEETPAAVRFDCMTQVNRLGIRHHRLWPLAARRAGGQRQRHFPPGAGELSLTSLQELMQRIRHHTISEQVGEINAALR